ncbi:hypothetical protein J2W32_000976 [Variovorax boronicumulans]|uniref:Uncharacterized protein n=1 Tax=Variovorax boronicumulans TaxID=436515 RepID=A0AAW8D027_9BURK|nr:hypothetical protein [Variovorax boronicumulans]MDQ0051940.1 hypothetical protein [Variovorax boronicumulans]
MSRVTTRWSSEEVALLRDMSERVYAQDIAHLLARTKASVACMAYSMGIKFVAQKPSRHWSDQDNAFLVENHRVITNQLIADRLGRTRDAIRRRIVQLRLAGHPSPARRWTEADDTYLLLAWQTDLLKDIAAALGRTVAAVLTRAKSEHKVSRPASYYASNGQSYRLFPPELRELIKLNSKLKKGIRDEEHRRLAGASLSGARSAPGQSLRC